MANIIASGDWWRLEDDGTLYVYCTGDMPPIEWFDYKNQITDVYVADTVTNIREYAFKDYFSLSTVVISNGVTRIEKEAFYVEGSDYDLTSVTIPNSVTIIGDGAFYGRSRLSDITIPSSVTSIGEAAFESCESLTSVTIPDGVTSIEGWTFGWCYNLTSITIPSSVTSIRYGAFIACDALTDVYYGGTETQLGAIEIDEGNESLTSATIHYTEAPTPEPVTLSSIAITTPPTKTAYAWGEVFDAAGMVVTATYSDTSTATVTSYSISPSGSLTANDTSITVGYTEDGVTVTATVAITVTAQPEIIVSGDFWALYDTGLLDVYSNGDMPDYSAGITYAPWYGYRSQIVSVTIENSVTSVGEAAFTDCSNLASATIPNGVTSIGGYAFDGCSALTSVTIPNGVTNIGGAAFRDCGNLASVTIPGSVTHIGDQAFRGCASLAGVTIPSGVTGIGFAMFYECGSLTSVTIPSGVTSIGQSAFYKCRRLASVAIPASVASIGNYAFDDCESIGDVYYGGTETQWGAVQIGNYNTALTSATIHYTEAPEPEPEPTPEPVAAGRINYTGQSKVIRRLCATVNELYAARPRLFVDEDGYISVEYEEANNGE